MKATRNMKHMNKNIKSMKFSELEELSQEIREFLIESISQTGGHLSSNLGVVELTIALHKVFSFPKDKLIFDVGHQSYIHKILTGRADQFDKLRKYGGISGFPKNNESEYDVFNSGHSSNSVSVALGLKRGLELNNDKAKVIALIGDGALTGGMAYEGLNDAGRSKSNLIIVLNDNEMSISQNVGSMAMHLAKIRTSTIYLRTKGTMTMVLYKIPFVGKYIYKFISFFKNLFKSMFIQKNIFEELGFYYAGPFDGHNVKTLYKAFNRIKNVDKPIVVHVCTKKGKGYKFAEERPDNFHGVKSYDIKTGEVPHVTHDFSEIFGDELMQIAEKNDKVVAITAAMPQGTGLNNFKNKYKNRYFDVAIAEGHGVSMAAGLAIGGTIPVFPVYSSFLQRGYDQLITDVCAMNLHCVFMIDRAGIVGEDGETHQGIFDISYLSSIPNMTVLAPATYDDLRFMLNTAIDDYHSPVAIRYPRGKESGLCKNYQKAFVHGKSQVVFQGTDVSILCEGKMLEQGIIAKEILEQKGISVELINLRMIKPLDVNTVVSSISKTKFAVVVENNTLYGGVYSQITGLTNKKVISVCVPDKFVCHGEVEELFKMLKMDGASIAKIIMKELL